MTGRLTTYVQMVQVLDDLPVLVVNARRAHALSLRAAAQESGVSFNALRRIEHGGNTDVASARLILLWLAS
jgi:transcriptional regulator with XRE-family HTH domain